MRKKGTPQECARRWNDIETEQLREMLRRGLPYDEMARRLGRSLNSIAGRLAYIRGTKQGDIPAHLRFTDHDYIVACRMAGGFPFCVFRRG